MSFPHSASSRCGGAPAPDAPNAGAETSLAVIERCLARIHQTQSSINAFITVMDEQARADALASDRVSPSDRRPGQLAGVAVAIKDDIDVAGVPCTVGSAVYRDRVPALDATVVRRLREAGAVILGKVGLNEFAYGVTCDNAHFGAIRNPWDPARIPGGSSGGSAAAVAADMCAAALGSDAGGSVRVPAALCGVTGLRPTWGTIPAQGTHQISWAIETVGPIARSAVDVARVLSVVADPPAAERSDALQAVIRGEVSSLAGVRVGLVGGFFSEAADPEVAGATRRMADRLQELGAAVSEVQLSNPQEAVEAGAVIIRADALAIHEQLLRAHAADYSADVRRRLELGAEISGLQLARAYEAGRRWSRRVARALADVDVLLTPTVPDEAPLREGADMIAQTEGITRFTLPFSLTGVPALSVPCGLTARGLPIGAQLVASAGRDDLLLGVGAAYQSATDWHQHRPAGAGGQT